MVWTIGLSARARAGNNTTSSSAPAAQATRRPNGSFTCVLLAGQARVQRWFVAPWQVQTMTAEPLVVAARLTSRHRPGNRTLLIVALALNVHCWLVPPLQS